MKTQLKKELDFVDATRKKRLAMAQKVLRNPEWLPPLLELSLEEDNKTGSRACWVLEFVVSQKLSLLFPHLDTFIGGLEKVTRESSIRPLAKICETLLCCHYDPEEGKGNPPLTMLQKEALTAACFDWLIKSEKAAPKAYSMQSLLLLGREVGWVHDQLKGVLEQNYAGASPAYQARARRILGKLS